MVKTFIVKMMNNLVEWVFRRRSPALYFMRIGLICIALGVGGGWKFDVSMPIADGSGILVFKHTENPLPTCIFYSISIVGLVLVVFGAYWEYQRNSSESKKIIVVEIRGLRDVEGEMLAAAIPKRLDGTRQSILVDIRQGIKDGEIVEPDAVLEKLTALPIELNHAQSDLNRSANMVVFGGLAPVPTIFLAGILIDDESSVHVFDWDRHSERWRELDGLDDGKRFESSGISEVPLDSREVALSVSVSYRIHTSDVRKKIGNLPLVELILDGGSSDCHWSEQKQRSLGSQFLETLFQIENKGVQKIHLFLAAPSSVSFRFGRLYDKRNLPEVVLYQYQRTASPPHTWGILMPVSGISKPTVVDN